MERKNINRGFKKLRVWQEAISLYVLAWKMDTIRPIIQAIDQACCFWKLIPKILI
jgi:hypothetical protein